MIDLRSDTVTQPTREMRHAMASAEVGDDVYGEDPTVDALQERVADLFGREAALLCPSGVMCNQVALRVLGTPGTEVLIEADAHIVNYEGGSGALLGGFQFRTVPGAGGILTSEQVTEHIRADHFPLTPTSLVCVEQTHNRRGGTYYSTQGLRDIRKVCDDAGVALYMDGARVFNAAVASGTPLPEYAASVDALMCCLSKSLGAPVGSVIVGDADAIAEAKSWRRRYGGAMRQAGVLAAAGLVALDRIDRLAEDHANAQILAAAASEVLPDAVQPPATNIVYVDDIDAAAVSAGLLERGVLAGAMDARTLRMVTHPDVSEQDCRTAADALRGVLAATTRP